MRNDVTEIVVLLDRSGSMHSIKNDMEGGFNVFLDKLREQSGEAYISLYNFDTEYDTVYVRSPLAAAAALTLDPRGGTALLDSMARCIDETGARFASMPEKDRPGRVLMIVITDGEENSSTKVSAEALRAKIEHQQDVYKWEFQYLGANQDSFQVSSMYGFAAHNTSNYTPTTAGIQSMFASVGSSANCYRATGNSKLDQDAIYQPIQQIQQIQQIQPIQNLTPGNLGQVQIKTVQEQTSNS